MNDRSTTTDEGPVSVGGALLETLNQECEALARINKSFQTQMDAMRDRDPERLEAATLSVTEEVGALARIQQLRARQTALLARLLGLEGRTDLRQCVESLKHFDAGATVGSQLLQVRERARNHAVAARERCQEFEFALQYASDLGRDLLLALQGKGVTAPTLAYTSSGAASGGNTRSIVNRQG